MKKLMFALVAILAAGMVQAAALNWSIANVYDPSDSTAKASGGTALLFVTSYSADGVTPTPTLTTIAAVTALLDAGDYSGASALASASGTLSSSGGISGATGLSGFTTDDTLSAFAVVFDVAQSNYLIVQNASGDQILTRTWSNATSAQTLAFANQAALSQDSSNWASVGASEGTPEPTSGLLLLMGVGLLGLRRKQK